MIRSCTAVHYQYLPFAWNSEANERSKPSSRLLYPRSESDYWLYLAYNLRCCLPRVISICSKDLQSTCGMVRGRYVSTY